MKKYVETAKKKLARTFWFTTNFNELCNNINNVKLLIVPSGFDKDQCIGLLEYGIPIFGINLCKEQAYTL